MKTKVSELQGAALDWAVSSCEGFETLSDGVSWIIDDAGTYKQLPGYSISWTQGGPIIEREKVCVAWLTKQDLGMEPEHYCVAHIDGIYCYYGPTPLTAAMRCYVASKLGDEVELPETI